MNPTIKKGCLWISAPVLLLLMVAFSVFAYYRNQSEPWPEPPASPVDLTFPHTVLERGKVAPDNSYHAMLELEDMLSSHPYWERIRHDCERYRQVNFRSHPTNFPFLVQLGQSSPELVERWSAAADGPDWPDAVTVSWASRAQAAQAFMLHQTSMRMFEGDLEGAQELLSASLDISSRYIDGTTRYSLDQGFQIAIQSISVFKSPDFVALLPETDLTQWQEKFLAAAKTEGNLRDVIRFDYLMATDLIPEVFEESPRFGEYLQVEIPRFLLKPLGSDPDSTTKNVSVIYQHLVAGLENPSHTQIAEQFAVDILANPNYWLGDDPVGRHWVIKQIGSTEQLQERENIRRSFMKGAALIVALEHYSKQHDGLPSSLNDLIPDIMVELPVDLWSQAPFIYKPNPDGSYLLYSPGPDEIDGGGDRNSDMIVRAREHYGAMNP